MQEDTSRGELHSQSVGFKCRQLVENDNILNGYMSQLYIKKVKLVNELISYSIMLHLVLLHCYFQTQRQEKKESDYFLWGGMVCGFFTLFFLLLGHRIIKEYKKQVYKREQQSVHVLFSCLIVLIMPYSFLESYKLEFNNSFDNNQVYVSDFKVNYLLSVCSCARIIPFFTAIIVNSKFSKGRTYRVCRMNGTFNSLIFAMRILFKQNPFLFISVVFISSVAIFSYAFRIAECEFISQYTVTAYMNMLWMTIITMTTVGFGDYTPKTPIGRIFGILCMSWGVLIVSVMVAVLTNTLSLSPRQKQSLILFKRLQNKKQLKNAASLFIRTALWRLWSRYKQKKSMKQTLSQRKKRSAFKNLRLIHRLHRDLGCQLDLYNQISRSFLKVEIDLNYLMINYRRVINFISEEMLFTQEEKFRSKIKFKRLD